MAVGEKIYSDGNTSWHGGMNTSLHPTRLAQDAYHKGINVTIPNTLGGIKNRPGIHCQNLKFRSSTEQDMFLNSGRVQGVGWFRDGNKNYLVIVVNGRVFRGYEQTNNNWYFEQVGGGANSPNRTKAWVNRVPNGAIVNDGQARPLLVRAGSARRAKSNEIGPGRAGVYVQNRFWYIRPDGVVYGSSLLDPMSLEEARLTNLWGFMAPEDNDPIIAIGLRKSVYTTVKSGQLIFATANNIYSVDVRGDRSTWDKQGSTGLGQVSENINGIGGISSFAFYSLNSNIYFRSEDRGLCNIKTASTVQAQDDFSFEQSPEINEWTDRDPKWLLDHCYITSTGERLLMTTIPSVNNQGFPYWNGMVCVLPAYTFSDVGRINRRFESLWTGIRPICMTDYPGKTMVMSYDQDGVCRLYGVINDSDYDIDSNFKRKEIESVVETRGYYFGSLLNLKKAETKQYTLRSIPRNLDISFKSRFGSDRDWTDSGKMTHKVESCKIDDFGCWCPVSSNPQSRQKVIAPKDGIPEFSGGSSNFSEFYYIQDRLEFKGSFTLDYWTRGAKIVPETTSTTPREREGDINSLSPMSDFTYSISGEIEEPNCDCHE